jgi:CRISPR-associated protein Csd1
MLSWLETTVGEAVENLARYFRLQAIPPLYRNQQPFFSVYQLAAGLLSESRRRDRGELDARTLISIVEKALKGGPLPEWLLFQAVRRSRAEQDVSPARAALIQLTLASHWDDSNDKEEVLNTRTRESPAFLCGRLLAILEWTQREAIGNPNTTLVDRFYGSASSAPASVFGTLLRGAQAHLGKLRREKRGLYVTIERQLEDVLSSLDSFPPVFSLKEQAVFALGYYYQRANRGREAGTDAGNAQGSAAQPAGDQ